MKIRNKIVVPVLALLFACAAFAFTACNNGKDEEVEAAAVVSSVTISSSAALLSAQEDAENGTVALTAGVEISEEGADVDVVWTTSNAEVATVTGTVTQPEAQEGEETPAPVYTGTVTAAGEGYAVITVAAGNKSATCVVAVTDAVAESGEELASLAASAAEGGVVALAAGSYTADAAFSAQNVALIGIGAAGAVTVQGGVSFAGGGKAFVSGITFTAAADETDEAAVSAAAGTDLTLRNVRVQGFVYGARIPAGTQEQQGQLHVYDSTFANVWCALAAQALPTLLRVTFSPAASYEAGTAFQWFDGTNYFAQIGGEAAQSAVPPSVSDWAAQTAPSA